MFRSVHLAYAAVRKEFFNVNLWKMIVEHPELFDPELHSHGDLPDSDIEDVDPPDFSFLTHHSSSSVHHITEEIPNTSDHMIVDLFLVIFQEKGKS
jgi:hypothetical protein